MKRKQIISLVAAVTLLAVTGIGATLAYFSDSAEAENVVTLGHVDIEIAEPSFPESGEVVNIIPGAVIEKDPTVTVQAESADAYVRLKLEIRELDEVHQRQLLEKKEDGTFRYLDMNMTDWQESDGYFYYIGVKAAGQKAGVLQPGQEVTLFRNVTIPGVWKNEMTEKTFHMVVSAEAIQADNFEPTTVGGTYGWFGEDGAAISAETYVK